MIYWQRSRTELRRRQKDALIDGSQVTPLWLLLLIVSVTKSK